jgi:hypothetical protein
MLGPGEQTAALCTVGWVLDLHGARNVEITRRDDRLVVAWENPSGGTMNGSYGAADLVLLDEQRDALAGRTPPGASWTARLRTLGQELADARAEVMLVAEGQNEERNGLEVVATTAHRSWSRWYPMDQLEALTAPEPEPVADAPHHWWHFWGRSPKAMPRTPSLGRVHP